MVFIIGVLVCIGVGFAFWGIWKSIREGHNGPTGRYLNLTPNGGTYYTGEADRG